MRRLIMKMSMSLDGFVGTETGELDWVFKSSDPQSKGWTLNLVNKAGLHIMGRTSFHSMATYWPISKDAFAAPMNEIPKATFTRKGFKDFDRKKVASLSPAGASWAEARVFEGDLTENIRKLKQEPGKPILAHGGAEFMRSLIQTGLIDEYNLAIHPVVLGKGLPIFTGIAKPFHLILVDEKSFPGGVVVHTYQPAENANQF
ncbi:MAG TPA: dihydrofolate reductase family protein [Flavisolibacter sp.]|nr:dihydrofolate reductase family protein [Flavisolibacter sp.]